MEYDAIIAGASFAGLGVARKLKGNILLIDRKPGIGAIQRSTCCTFVHTLKKLGCEESILQITKTVILHIGSNKIAYHLKRPFATIDYKKFCQLLFNQSQAQFLQAKVYGVKDDTVITDKGNFQSECIVDATGWEAVLASSLEKDFAPNPPAGRTGNGKSFGLETTPFYKNKVIEIWVNPQMMPKGVTWIFPCQKFSRFGIASYIGNTRIKQGLKAFLKEFNLQITDDLHGGFFTNKFRKPTAGNIFVVGGAAGQCLPLTGEGIRPSLYFGKKCGEVIQQIIEGEKTLEQGLKEYREFIMHYKRYYAFLSGLQKMFITLPNAWIACFAKFMKKKPVFKYAEKKYVGFANLDVQRPNHVNPPLKNQN